MAFEYSRLQSTASRLIAAYGRAVTIRTRSATGTAWAPTIAWTDATAYAVAVNISLSEIDGTLIKADDKQFLVDYSVTIDTDSRMIDGTNEYSIVLAENLTPGDTRLLWRVFARK